LDGQHRLHTAVGAYARGALALSPCLPEEVKTLDVWLVQDSVIRDFVFLNLPFRILTRYFFRNGEIMEENLIDNPQGVCF